MINAFNSVKSSKLGLRYNLSTRPANHTHTHQLVQLICKLPPEKSTTSRSNARTMLLLLPTQGQPHSGRYQDRARLTFIRTTCCVLRRLIIRIHWRHKSDTKERQEMLHILDSCARGRRISARYKLVNRYRHAWLIGASGILVILTRYVHIPP